MKNAKKMLAAVLTVMMVLSLCVTAFAADNGTITVENATVGKTYDAYKIFDAKIEGTDKVAYYIDSTSPWYSVVANSGLFDLRQVGGSSSTQYNVVAKDTASDEDILNLFKGQFEYADATDTWTCKLANVSVADTETAATDTVEFSVPYGYYLITSTLGANVTIDTNHPTVKVIDKNQKPTWDNEPENPGEDDDPNPGKVIVNGDGSKTTVNSANYGDTVKFDIGVNATNYVDAEQVTYYYINDEISDAFKLKLTGETPAFHPVVTVGGTTLTEGTDYTVTQTGNKFEVIVNWANITLNDDGEITKIESLYDANTEIHVVYEAIVNADGKDVVLGGDGNLNTANFTWNTNKVGDEPDVDDGGTPDDPTDDTPVPPTTPGTPYVDSNKKTTTTYVYALAIQKVDENGKALKGAQFSIADLQATGSAGVYSYCAEGTEGATTLFDTDANGMLVIKGVKEGDYVVTEETAPDGYNKLTTTATITAALAEEYTNTTVATFYYDAEGNLVEKVTISKIDDITTLPSEIKTKLDEKLTQAGLTNYTDAGVDTINGWLEQIVGIDSTKTTTYKTSDIPVYGIAVVNQAGTELPSTGGIGTTLFYVIGGILVLAAVVLLVTRKRMGAEN